MVCYYEVFLILLLLPTTLLSTEHSDDRVERSRKPNLRHPPSPCPSVFSYEGKEAENDRWFGVILITADELVTGLRLDIKLDKPANLLGNWVGEVKSKNNIQFMILDLNRKVKPGPPLSVRIFVKFPRGESAPKLQNIKFNGRQICPEEHGSEINRPTQKPVTTVKPVVVTHKQNDRQSNVVCGKVAVQPAPLITHGQSTARGQFPWHAALYQSKDINLEYICGGSLIGHRTILTAAHCVTSTPVLRPVQPDSLLVYLGKYHLNQWSEGGVQDKQVVEVLVHPGFNTTNYQSDLALLILSSPVEFTTYVGPVCLWDRTQTDLQNVVDKEGTVAGWGFDETGKISEELKMAEMPVVSQEDCLWSNREFFPQFTSDTTYCAGFRNGSSVCNGDSGGGMVFPKNHKNGTVTWMLRGIVSISKPKGPNLAICDPKNFVVFTDAAKYLDWIQSHIK